MKEFEKLKTNTVEIIQEEELKTKLQQGKKLVVKYGIDPTAPIIHIGHAVSLRKLRQFQELGHKVVIIVGDFTAKIGDPSFRDKGRPKLSEEEIQENMKNYKSLIFKILNPDKTEFRYNSEWLTNFNLNYLVDLLSHFTVAQLLEREDFAKRYKENKPIGVHEILYPIFQAYDSVMIKADVEVGGQDQKFNLLFAREMQKMFEMQPQTIVTLPLLEGLDGVRKMSKSYNNYVSITEEPKEMYGKLMSIPDEMIVKYLHLTTEMEEKEIRKYETLMSEQKINPMEVKRKLAYEVVKLYHSSEKAKEAEEEFIKVFSKKEIPTEIPSYQHKGGKIWVVKLLVDAGLVGTRSEARRVIQQGGVAIDGEVIRDIDLEFVPKRGTIIRVGKRRFRKIE